MSTIIILCAAAFALLLIIALCAARLAMNTELEYAAIDEEQEVVYPSLTSSMDARLFTSAAPALARGVKFDPSLHTLDVTPSAEAEFNTESLPAICDNRRAVIAVQPTMALDLAEIEIVEPPLFKTVAEAEPYGLRRDANGRKRAANGRFVKD